LKSIEERLTSWGEDLALRVWDGSRQVASFEDHNDRILAVAASRQKVYTGSRDHWIREWDLARGQVETISDKHRGAVTSLSLSPDGKTLASASEDGTVRLHSFHETWHRELGQDAVLYGVNPFTAVVHLGDTICAGDVTGQIWLLEWSPEDEKQEFDRRGRRVPV
jgi:WD40 repeat protein